MLSHFSTNLSIILCFLERSLDLTFSSGILEYGYMNHLEIFRTFGPFTITGYYLDRLDQVLSASWTPKCHNG
jgi:hypothetical protein